MSLWPCYGLFFGVCGVIVGSTAVWCTRLESTAGGGTRNARLHQQQLVIVDGSIQTGPCEPVEGARHPPGGCTHPQLMRAGASPVGAEKHKGVSMWQRTTL
jgi:hypothetical protein